MVINSYDRLSYREFSINSTTKYVNHFIFYELRSLHDVQKYARSYILSPNRPPPSAPHLRNVFIHRAIPVAKPTQSIIKPTHREQLSSSSSHQICRLVVGGPPRMILIIAMLLSKFGHAVDEPRIPRKLCSLANK